MIRRNPRGDTPVVHETAFVDHTAIIFSEDVVRTNLQLARDYRRIQNEF